MLKILSSLPPLPLSSSFAIALPAAWEEFVMFSRVRLPRKYQDTRQGASWLTCPCPLSFWQGKQPWGLSSLFSNWPFIISFLKEKEKGWRSGTGPLLLWKHWGLGDDNTTACCHMCQQVRWMKNREWVHKRKCTVGKWPLFKAEKERKKGKSITWANKHILPFFEICITSPWTWLKQKELCWHWPNLLKEMR